LIQGQANSKVEPPLDIKLESEVRELIASGNTFFTIKCHKGSHYPHLLIN